MAKKEIYLEQLLAHLGIAKEDWELYNRKESLREKRQSAASRTKS